MASVVQAYTGIRSLLASDLPALMLIEEQAYEFGWTLGIFEDCLRVGYGALAYVEADVLVAYGIVSARAGECHILNLCVSPTYARRGIGRQLLHAMLDYGRTHEAHSVFLEVRPSNHAAIQLYLDEGFNQIGQRRNYYPAKIGREDALVFAKELLPAE